MLPPHDQLPPPARPRIERTSPLRDLVPLAALIVVVFAGLTLYRSAMEPIAVSGTSVPMAAEQSIAAPSPFVIVFPDTLALITHTPEATPEPTPTYAMQPTPKPPDVCLTSTPRGSVCTQPLPPLPTSTPMAACPVSPGELCVWDGGPVTWLSPTPSPERSILEGANS